MEKLRAQGYRPFALSVSGDPADPRYSALWVKQRVGLRWREFHDVVVRDYQATVDDLERQGFAQTIVTATSAGDKTLFAGVFEAGGPLRFARHGLAFGDVDVAGTFNQVMEQARIDGYVPRSIDVYGTAQDPRFAGVWTQDTATLWAWHWDTHDEHERRLLGEGLGGQFPSQVAVGSGRWLSVFREGRIGPWEAPFDMTADQYSKTYIAATTDGLGRRPLCLQAGGQGADTRYAATFATTDDTMPRTWRVDGPPIPGAADLDSVLSATMKRYGIRAASVAIAKDGTKYLCRAYTRAEKDWPTTKTTTTFRIASLSKIFTAAAIQLLADDGVFDLDTSVFGYLVLIPWTPHDTSHDAITIRHCATQQSGLPRNFETDVSFREIGQKLGHMASIRELAEHIYTVPLQFTPGKKPPSFPDDGYSNSAFYLLEAVVEQATGERVVDFVNRRLANPIGIRDIRAGATDMGRSLPGEVGGYDAAGAYLSQLYLGPDMMSPAAYGGSLLIDSAPGTGGFVTSASSVARFIGLHNVGGLGGRMEGGRDGIFAGTFATAISAAKRWDYTILLNRESEKGESEIAAGIDLYLTNHGSKLTPFDVDENFPIRGVLLAGRLLTQPALNALGYDQMRNALIVELTNHSNQTNYQGYDNATLAGMGAVMVFLRATGIRDDAALRTMSADDQRNVLIVEIDAQTGVGPALQALTNMELVLVALGSDRATRGRAPGVVSFWIRGILLAGGFRTQYQLNTMSRDQMRNTLIVELGAHSNETRLQAYTDGQLEGAGAVMVLLRATGIRPDAALRTMSADDQRNVLIVELARQTGFGAELQGMSNLQLVLTALGVRPVIK